MKTIGILGFGTIGQSIYQQILEEGLFEVTFIYTRSHNIDIPNHLAIHEFPNKTLLESVDLVVEATVADTIKSYGESILTYTNLLPLSVTAFADEHLEKKLYEIASKFNHHIFIPHGAVLGLDGIYDLRNNIKHVEIHTIKNPKSLNREDTEKVTLFEGSTRDVCKLKPRNVNVHAAVALASIGLDQAKSILISDPNTKDNTHCIKVTGNDFYFEIMIRSMPKGAVTSATTPLSAYGSIKRALTSNNTLSIV